ncbi:hypothetical protein Ancab_023156 [Ancistrocladus abbreviatus]
MQFLWDAEEDDDDDDQGEIKQQGCNRGPSANTITPISILGGHFQPSSTAFNRHYFRCFDMLKLYSTA